MSKLVQLRHYLSFQTFTDIYETPIKNPWGKKQRNIYLKQFDESFWLLAENPDIGKTCDEIRIGYRKFLQGSHVIFYLQIGSQQIKIIRILHKNMDVNPVLGA